MAEEIYEKQGRHDDEKKELRFLNNRRQIGYPAGADTEVFIEDYAWAYAGALAKKEYAGCVVGVLIGEQLRLKDRTVIVVRGVLEAGVMSEEAASCFAEECWSKLYRELREFFSENRIVGWCLGGPGFLLEDEEKQKKIQENNFGGEGKLFLKIDSIEKTMAFFEFQNGRRKELPGYYVFYEKNEGMQRYMAHTKLPIQESAPEVKPQKERAEVMHTGPAERERKSGFGYRLFYATGGVLACLAVLVIGALTIQIREREHLKALLNEQEQAVAAFCKVHEVTEGETMESICKEYYGTEEQADDIRKLNGLQGDENPVAGQKLLLP